MSTDMADKSDEKACFEEVEENTDFGMKLD